MQEQYSWLKKVQSPKVIAEAMAFYGVTEIVGPKHNATIMGWAKTLNMENTYNADEIAWCGLFVAIVVKNANFEPVKAPLWARNWASFGTKQTTAKLGDILVFSRGTGGHVGFYVGEDKEAYHVLGGNQSNMVNVTRILKTRLLAIRRCPWKIAEPKEVKKIMLDAKGQISKNEA